MVATRERRHRQAAKSVGATATNRQDALDPARGERTRCCQVLGFNPHEVLVFKTIPGMLSFDPKRRRYSKKHLTNRANLARRQASTPQLERRIAA